MELETYEESFIIQVHNKSWDDITVSVTARPFVKLLEGNIFFFWFHWLWSNVSTKVCSGQKKDVSKVTKWNTIIHTLGSYRWRLYNIRVQKSDGFVAECTTPLHCTWVVEDKGIFQEDDTEKRCKFEMPIRGENYVLSPV